jgi:hypothetical protein
MAVLSLIDALIFLGWSSLLVGFLLKAIHISTSHRPMPLGLSPMDFVWATGACLLLALGLAARTWLKANQARTARAQSAAAPLRPARGEGVGAAPPASRTRVVRSAASRR